MVAGRPRHPALKKVALNGKLDINFKTVADEAGRSRTLIGYDGCQFPDVRARVKELKDPIVRPTDAAAVIQRLRADKREMEAKLKAQEHEMKGHINARWKAEEERDRWKRACERFQRGETGKGGSVVAFSRGS